MSINPNCPNRIKPKLLREIKTEALLVFIRTTLEQSFYQIENQGYNFPFETTEDSKFVYKTLEKLLNNIQDCVVNSSYLMSLTANSNKSNFFKVMAKKEEPLMQYYDSIVKGIEKKLTNGTYWIPELVVIALLSEWIIEEEKSTYLYPFLADINYMELMNKYDNAKAMLDEDKKDVLIAMYRLSSTLIESLKTSTYKINTHRKKTKRKK